MISPSPIEQHVEIARAFGSRTQPLDAFVGRGVLRRLRRRTDAAADGIDVPITIRPAAAKDAHAIARLALLDGGRLPAGQQVLAEADGRLLAATDIATGRTVADPFVPSAGVATLLRLRAEQVRPRRVA
jgi:hypothetical protein